MSEVTCLLTDLHALTSKINNPFCPNLTHKMDKSGKKRDLLSCINLKDWIKGFLAVTLTIPFQFEN